MKEFLTVMGLDQVLAQVDAFPPVAAEEVPLEEAAGRVLAEDLRADSDLPGFPRSTVDGYAVKADATFGASEGSPALLDVVGTVVMGRAPGVAIGPGQAARIPTGGELP
ncbi:MAG: molybdopterin molybdenumtransferase MoeA, partial [Desulfobacterales bacterium]|nr:molybdopterin molybdenumtransferase MoeA [Desulfobacterales bacterium]